MRNARYLLPLHRLQVSGSHRTLIDLGDRGRGNHEDVRPVPPVVLNAAEPIQRAILRISVAVRVDELAKEDIFEESGGEDGGHGLVVGDGREAD